MKNTSTSLLAIADLQHDPRNARKHNERNLKTISDSLREVGAARSIVIDENNIVLAGNGTIQASIDAGISNVRVIEAKGDEIIAVRRSNLTAEQKTKVALFDNRSAELAEWDTEVLEELSQELDLSGMWSEEELAEMFNEDVPVELDESEPNAIDVSKPAITARGDLYELGAHRLICADCTDTDAVQSLMQGAKADMVFTDPPYDLESREFFNTIALFCSNHAFIMNSDKNIIRLCAEHLDLFKRLFAVDFRQAHIVSNNQPMTRVDIIAEFNFGENRFVNTRDGFTTLLEVCKLHKANAKENHGHSQAKKPELPAKFIEHYSKRGDVVLDVFGGSGSTLIACEQLQRKAYLVELDERYCDAIVRRYITHCEKFSKGALVTRNKVKILNSEYQA